MAPCELSPSVTAADPAWWRPAGRTRWPLTLTLNIAGPLTGANSQPRATDSRPHHHDVPRHEPTLIAAVSSRTTAGSRCGTFRSAGLTADRTLSNVSPAANERSSKLRR